MKRSHLLVLAVGILPLFGAVPETAAETTFYVGKHFEVRAHDQPTKYVFNGATRVARVTGSLSTNTRVQRFRLRAGWNLLSLAVSATNLADQLQGPGIVASARSWNAQTGAYLPVPQVAPSGMVLWVNATNSMTLSVVGAYADPVHREVPAGATYLASAGLEAWTPALPASVAVWSYDSPTGGVNASSTWRARLTGDLSSINDLPNTFPPGHAFHAISPAPFALGIPDPVLRVRYYHQDHLGSSSVMTDANGALVEETAFYPFGVPRHEHRLRPMEEPYQFTQKERDSESGLHYFEARYIAAHLARFISADPKYLQTEAPPNDSQAINLYAYARGNPIRYVDPTGLDFRDFDRDAKRAGRDNARRDGSGVDWGRVGMIAGGAGEAAGGVTLCATLVGCIVGAPLVAHGSDKIATGIVGADQTLTSKYLGEDFEEGMDIISFAAGGAGLARGIQGKLAERASRNLVLNIERQSTYTLPPYSSGPPPRAQTLPGIGGGSPAAAEVAKLNSRRALGDMHWNAAVNSSPKEIWTQATIDATRSHRELLPTHKDRADNLKSIIDAADALFE